MAQRKQVGFVFSYSESWIGGTYYILNIIHALNTLSEKEKPIVTILSSQEKDFELVQQETEYPFLKYKSTIVAPSFETRLMNKFFRIFTGKNLFDFTKLDVQYLDMIYPRYTAKIQAKKSSRKVFWIPDFQDIFLPHYFSKEEIEALKQDRKKISITEGILVTSSKDAQNHFNNLFPISKPKQFVMPFAVTHPEFKHLDVRILLDKFFLPKEYFFAPNQFWAHKNHAVIVNSIKRLKDEDINVVVAFSGKESDYRNQNHIDKLKKMVIEYELQDNIKFLGFLDRNVQLQLMKNAMAIIQPSLFEGWSTVVEDAKSLNKHILLSDLEVHKEQISVNCTFFEAENDEELAELISTFKPNQEIEIDYNDNVVNFGKRFTELIEFAS